MKTIIIYGTVWCHDCITAKSILDTYGIAYDFVNIDEDDLAAEKVMKLNGGRRVVPTIFINNVSYTNPSQMELIDLIKPFVSSKAS